MHPTKYRKEKTMNMRSEALLNNTFNPDPYQLQPGNDDPPAQISGADVKEMLLAIHACTMRHATRLQSIEQVERQIDRLEQYGQATTHVIQAGETLLKMVATYDLEESLPEDANGTGSARTYTEQLPEGQNFRQALRHVNERLEEQR
jgi:hypothetical protein